MFQLKNCSCYNYSILLRNINQATCQIPISEESISWGAPNTHESKLVQSGTDLSQYEAETFKVSVMYVSDMY